MTMSPHITSLCKSLNFFLWNISRIRRFIDQETCNTTMRALVLSKLDYTNALLLGCKKADIFRLQRLQNKAARIIFQVPKMHSSSELLSTLHWLPVDKRIIFKTLLYIFKALNDRAPVYLSNSISIFIPTREGLRSSMDILRLDVPRSSRQYGLRSFSQFGPSLWNKFPLAIRTSPLILCSKRNSKRTCSSSCDRYIFTFCLYFLFAFCLVFYSIYFCFIKRFDQLWKGAIVSIVYVCMVAEL